METSILGHGLEILLLIGVLINISQANIDLNITEKDDGTGNISVNVSTEVEECPSSNQCLKTCPVGYARNERGCPDCSMCSTEGLFEGDIIVDGKEDLEMVLYAYAINCNETSDLHLWPKVGNSVKIPYVVDNNSLGATLIGYINSAIADVHNLTCIRFVERGQERDYIKFQYDTFCGSRVGRRGGMQLIALNPGCALSKGNVIHEIMHTLGFWHEQSRADRDTYIKIKWNNVQPGSRNFGIKLRPKLDYLKSPYDIDSVMQCDGYTDAADPNKPTVINKATNQPIIAQRAGFSIHDVALVKSKYKCGEVSCMDLLIYCHNYRRFCLEVTPSIGRLCPLTCGLC